MARGFARVTLVGNLGRDPELRYTQNGTAVCNFSVACTAEWTRDGEKKSRTEWVQCVAWRQLAEICAEHLKKGKQIYVDGTLQTRDYKDRDGNKRRTTEVHITNMLMLGSKADAEHDPNVDAPHPEPGSQDVDGQIPF